MSFLPLILWISLAFTAFAAPSVPPSLFHRDAAAAPTPSINATATVLSHDGIDLTSSFQVMIYHQPHPVHTDNNTHNNYLNNRDGIPLVRPINHCPSNETFLQSFCTPEGAAENSLQRFSYTCRTFRPQYAQPSGEYTGTVFDYQIRQGYCTGYEICVNSLMPGTQTAEMANCVQDFLFTPSVWPRDPKEWTGFEVALDLQGKSAYAVLSKADKSTAIEVDTFDVDAWVDGGLVNEEKSSLGASGQRKKCRDCFDLETAVLGPKTDGLEVQAKLLTAGQLAVGGFLWLAVMSG